MNQHLPWLALIIEKHLIMFPSDCLIFPHLNRTKCFSIDYSHSFGTKWSHIQGMVIVIHRILLMEHRKLHKFIVCIWIINVQGLGFSFCNWLIVYVLWHKEKKDSTLSMVDNDPKVIMKLSVCPSYNSLDSIAYLLLSQYQMMPCWNLA
jgi:hypothetical protein